MRTYSKLLVLLGLASCAAAPTGVPGRAADINDPAAEPADVKPPFMFSEASLPAGFPAPGPVGEVIVKEYPAYRAARIAGQDSNAMFQPLFRHIQSNGISMTAPVEMSYAAETSASQANPTAMAFLYGDMTIGRPGPAGNVEVVDLPAQTVLSVTVRGSYDEAYRKGLRQLEDWLARNPGRFEVAGAPRFLGYNSPLVPWFLRVGEAQIPVRPAADASQ
jgi:effector-binding domain-containing protein